MAGPKVFLGIDPGLNYTGFCVCSVSSNGQIRLVHLEVLHNKESLTLKEKYAAVRAKTRSLCKLYCITDVICEAFEVMPWKGARKGAVGMSKLINEISAEVYSLRKPFLLSSPFQKKGFSMETLSKARRGRIEELPKTHQDHAFDALVHILSNVSTRKGGGSD